MPEPITWDTPGQLWDSGLTWDQFLASPPTKMNTTKAIVDFSGYSAAELGPLAQVIHTQMTANAATFPSPIVTLAALQTLINTYDQKLVARASRASADILAFNTARAALEQALGALGNDVNGIANGDATIVSKSGFPSYETTRPADPTPPDAPSDLRVRHGELSGTILIRYKPKRRQSANEIQMNPGDPNIEAGWVTKGMFQGGKAELQGLTPGALIWVRVRTVGIRGVMGVWSDPAQIRVV